MLDGKQAILIGQLHLDRLSNREDAEIHAMVRLLAPQHIHRTRSRFSASSGSSAFGLALEKFVSDGEFFLPLGLRRGVLFQV